MKKVLLFSLILYGTSVFAQTEPAVKDTALLTFEEAVKIGLMNSMTLNQQKNQLELSQMYKTSSIASLAPSVSINGTASRFDGNSFNRQQARVVNGVADNVTASIDANLNLFNGFNSLNTVKQSARALDAQNAFVKRTSQDVINTVALQYLQVLLDMELLRIAQENFEVQDQQLQQIHEFVATGSRAPVDELNQDALTKGAELTLVQAEIALNNDKALLTQTLLIDPFDEFGVVKPEWDINKISNQNLNPNEMLQTAMVNRGDYLQAKQTELSNKYGMYASKGLMAPNIYAFASYGSAYNFIHDVPDSIEVREGINRSFKDQFTSDNTYLQYGLGLRIPLFNGLQNRANYVQQRVRYDNSKLTTRNTEVLLKNDIQRSRRNFDGAKKGYAVSQAQLRAAEEAYKLETERYNLGVTSLVDYITANRSFIQAQTNFAQSEYRLIFQRIQLEYALGTLKIEDFQ
ncbi:MAG TPA: TolC family protein [Ohtaekwangia sp.]